MPAWPHVLPLTASFLNQCMSAAKLYTSGMPLLSAFTRPPSTKRKLGIVVAMLLLSVLVHLAVIEWLQNELQLITLDSGEEDDSTVSVTLQAPPPAAERLPKALPVPAKTREPVASVPRTPPTAPEPAPAVPPPPPVAENNAPTTADAAPLAPTAPAAPSAAATDATSASAPVPAASETAETSAPALFTRAIPPPPVDLSFDVVAVRKGSRTAGNGSMSWRHNGQQYKLTVDIGVLFFTLLTYRSEGELGKLGVAPELYAEKRVGRSETNTHFHRDRQQISFSASTKIAPARGGEQDRGSWIWQVASLGRGDPDKFEPGLAFEMNVAGTKSLDVWRIYVNGRENVVLPEGSVSAWRLSVIPGAESFERQFDLWLAPDRHWYPVRLRHEDKNGNSIEMQLTKIRAKNEG